MPHCPALVPLTEEARAALNGRDRAPLDRLPFRIGRESRVGRMDGRPIQLERRHNVEAAANDLCLQDTGSRLHVSRQHLFLDRAPDGGLSVTDVGSSCGTLVDGRAIGGSAGAGTVTANDGSEIVLGTSDSPYRFRVVGLEHLANLAGEPHRRNGS